MANRVNNKRYNKLLSYRNNYYGIGGTINNLYNSVTGNPDKDGNITTGLFKGMSGASANMLKGVSQVLGGAIGNAIGGGMETGVGKAIGSLTNVIPIPGLNIVGGLINRAFGSKLNQENINATNTTIDKLNNFQSNASSYDTLANTWGTTSLGNNFSDSYIGKDGWFSNKAKKKAGQLREKMNLANAFVENSLQNNADNLSETTMNNLEANYAALGGFLDTAGADFPTGLMLIDEGGTHESNPYEGVPMGVAPDGKPNLVEEGEAVYNDYVFSNRLTVPKAVRSKYKLRGNKDLTFADAAKQLSKGAAERPNDPISKDTLNDIMNDLIVAQEALRSQQENNKFAYGGEKGHLHGEGDWLIGDDFFSNRDFQSSNLKTNIPYSRSQNTNLGEGVSQKDHDDFTNYALTLDDSNPYWTGLSKATGKDIKYLKSNYKALRSDGKYGYVSLTPKRVTQPTTSQPIAPQSTTPQPNTWYTTEGRIGGDISFNPEDAGLFGYNLPNDVVRKSTLDNGDTVNYVATSNTQNKPSASDTPLDLGTSNESLRYAPALGLGLASITDALGLTNRPDYSEASMIEAATRGGSYMPVAWNPIGNKLTYRPFDRDYYTNKLNAESGATRRAIANQSGGNSGRAIAGLLAADYNAQDKLGDLFRKSEEYNLEQRQKVEDFNRATNQANSQGMLQADMANQQAYNSARDFNLRGTMAAAEMRQKARMASEQAKSANLSGFLQTLGDIGYENKGMNVIRRLAEADVFRSLSEPMVKNIATKKAYKRYKSLTKKKRGEQYAVSYR